MATTPVSISQVLNDIKDPHVRRAVRHVLNSMFIDLQALQAALVLAGQTVTLNTKA
jgi:hypothetical protein